MTDMDVCLLLEGTYPFVTGGVSSWVHTLITELKHLRFGVVHISPREGYFPHGYSYKLPENVVGVREVFLHQYKLPKKASRESIREQIQLFRGFIQDLQDGNTQAFRDFCAAVNQDLGGGLNAASIFQTKESWDVLVESYSQEASEESFINYFWTWRYALFPLFNILAAQLPDAHVYHTISTGYAGMLAAGATLKKGRPMVLTEHGIYAKERRIEIHRADWIQDWSSGEIVAERKPPFFKRFWTRQFAMMSKVTYAHANEIYTLYEGNRRTQIQDGAEPERTNVIPNGIDLVRYGEAAKQFDARAENERFTLAFVGRVSPIKDVKTFLRAVRLVANEVPNVRARILGPMDEDPKYVDACKKLFQRLHLDGIAAFEGKVNVLEEFPKIDLLVLTSISEAQPLVILEAGPVGLPTVTTDVGSCSELLNGSSPEDRALGAGGLLTPIASPGETAKAILQLIRDRDQLKRMGRAMRQRVHRFYALKDMIAAYGDIYGKFQPGGRCFGGVADAQRSAEKRAEPVASSPAPASETPHTTALIPADPALDAPPAPVLATAPAPTPISASSAAIAPTAPLASIASPSATPSEAPRLATPVPESAPSAPSIASRPLLESSSAESVPPIEIEPLIVPLVIETETAPAAMAAPLPLLAAPVLPELPRILEAMAPPAAPFLAPSSPDDTAEARIDEPPTAVEPAQPEVTARVSTRSVLGELLQLQGLLDAWSAIDVELALLVQDAENAAHDHAITESEESSEHSGAEASDDEFELGEDDVPADLPLSCEALGADDAAIEMRAASPRPETELGLELIDDLMRELADDVQGLRSALEREGEEISQLEQDLICLDETEKLAAEQHGPLPEGTQSWWGSGEAPEAARSERATNDDPVAAEPEASSAPAPELPHASGSSDDEEEWLELEDEELPRDMPLSCDVLGESDEDDAAGREESDESAAAPRAVVPPSPREEEALQAEDETLELGDEELEAELPLRSEERSLDDEAEDAEPVPAQEPSAIEHRLPIASAHEDAELATSDDEFELGEDDVPADLPLSCEALGADGAAIETRAASPRRDTEPGLELIDDLMRELADDVQGLRSALQREGEEISQLEQELICLDETEKLAAEQHGPLPEGTQSWWGSGEAPEAATSERAANDDPVAAEPEASSAPAPEMSQASGSSDDEEEWLELEDEELPRDMPLSCDVLGEGDEDDAAGREESDESAAAPRAVVPQSTREEEALEANDEVLDLGDEEPEAELSLHSEELDLDVATEASALPHAAERFAAAHEDAELATSDDEFELGEDDVPADLPLSCEALGADDAAIETRAASTRRDTELGLELIDDLMRELADDVQGLRSALQREGEEISQLEQELICLDETEKLAAEQHGPLPEGTQSWWGSGEAPEAATSERAANDDLIAAEPEASSAPAPEMSHASGSSDDEEEWLELEDEELPRDMPLSCDVLGESEEDEAAGREESDESAAAPRAVVPPSPREEEALQADDETLELGDEELEAELPLRSEERSLDDEAEDAEPVPAEEPSAIEHRLPIGSAHEDAELATSDDEFELGEDDVPADLPLSCEALGADDAAIETRTLPARRDTELDLELIDDLMLELADDVQGLRSALQREGEEISQLEQDLICLDESTPEPTGGSVENATTQAHLGLRELAGNAPEGAGEIRFAAPPAPLPPDPDVIAELDEPEAEAGDEDEEGWLELEDEELSRDLPLSCSALGESDDEDIDELASERDEEDPA